MKKLFYLLLLSALQLSAQTFPCADTFEPNNTRAQTTALNGLNFGRDNLCLTAGDEDWFTFPYRQTVFYFKIRGGTPTVAGNYKLNMYNSSGIVSFVTAPARENPLGFNYAPPLDTYIEVYAADGRLIASNDDNTFYKFPANKMAIIQNLDLNNYKNLVCPTPNKSDVTVVTTATAADFTWKAIDGVASFTFEWRHESVTTWNTQTVTTPKVSLTGLQSNTRYVYQIRGNCTNGLPGSNSFMTGFITQKAFTPIFTVEKRTVETIAKAGQPTVPVSANVEWKLGNQVGNFFSLSIEKSTTGNGQDGKVIITTTENTTTADRKGSFEIQPQYAGLSAIKIDITQKGKVETVPATCAVPANLTHQVSGSTLTASWGAVTGVSYYKIDMQLNGGAWGPWGTGQTTTNQFVSSGAQSGANVCYKVQAVCTNGITSSVSNSYCFKLDGGPVATCGTPANLTHMLLTNDQATISWDAISGATSYDIYSNYGTATYTFLQNVSTNSITRSVSPNLNVCFKVVAVCPNAVRSPQSSEYCFDSRMLAYPNVHNVPATAGYIDVTLEASEKWTATIADNWLSVSPKSGNAGKNQKIRINYTTLPNSSRGRTTANGRMGKITFVSNSTSLFAGQVNVIQSFSMDDRLLEQKYYKQEMSRYKGITLYRNLNGNNLFIIDLQQNANLNFQVGGNGKTLLDGTKIMKRETIEEAFKSALQKYPQRAVASFNGQYFGFYPQDKNYAFLDMSVYIEGINYGNQLTSGPIKVSSETAKNYSPAKVLSLDGSKAKMIDVYELNQSRTQFTKKTGLVNPLNGIAGYTINEGLNSFANFVTAKTMIGVVDADFNLNNDYEKVVVFTGKDSQSNIAKLMDICGVNVKDFGDYFIADIIKLDGSGSSQCYGYDNNGSLKSYFESTDKKSCNDEYDGCATRRIPQTITILSGNNFSNKRVSGIDSNLTISADLIISEKEGITTSPNPTKNGLVRLQLGGMGQEDEVEVGVFDEIGKQAGSTLSGKVMEINGKEIQLPTNQTPKMFIIHALNKTTGKKYSDKVMVSGQ